ncbi:uncharacterized protein [Littorina saxatilis]|uniref:uncharacterized protein isoform X2 n=1 Tax=Littorina saxatilis TaxID=31220 RepID=UPI0038B572BB
MQEQTCPKCGHRFQASLVQIGTVEGDVYNAHRCIVINSPEKEDAVTMLSKEPSSGDLNISEVKNLTLTQKHITINVEPSRPVKIHIATKPEEVQAAGDGVLIVSTDWSNLELGKVQPMSPEEETQETRQSAAQPTEKEVIISSIIHQHTEQLTAEIIGFMQREDPPKKVLKDLYDREHLRLLGLTKRLDFLMMVDMKDLAKVLQLEPEIQGILAEMVPPHCRQEVRWGNFSHLPLQRSIRQQGAAETSEGGIQHYVAGYTKDMPKVVDLDKMDV